jgi:hypothetical protein
MESATIRRAHGRGSEFDEVRWNSVSEPSYEVPMEEDSEGSDKEWKEDNYEGFDDGPIRRSARKRKLQKFGDSYMVDENEDEDKFRFKKKKKLKFGESGKKKSLKKKVKKLQKKPGEKKSKDESSGTIVFNHFSISFR